jgi:hypothetical protein
MRIEETANLCDQVEQSIRQQIPAEKSITSLTTLACPTVASIFPIAFGSGWELGRRYSCGPCPPIIIPLTNTFHYFVCAPKQFPGVAFAFLPADMVSQILNFGLPAPIDVQVVGTTEGNRLYASRLLEE